MAKQLEYSETARQAIKRGVDILARAVAVTLGPKGRNVVIARKFGAPLVTKDGVTVAKEIVLKDPYEDMGAQLVKEVASKTADNAGDGTTTATILARAIVREGFKNVTAGANPMALKRGIDAAVEAITNELKKSAVVINNDKMAIAQVASLAANSDKEIGTQIAEAMEKVGKDGVITVEEAKSVTSELTVVEGMQFSQGYLSPYFVTDAERMEVVLENALILIHEKRLGSVKDLVPLLESIAKTRQPLLLIAEDFDGEVLMALAVNKIRGALNVCAVKAPGFGDKRKLIMEDLAILTGGKCLTDELGQKLTDVTMEMLGKAKRVTISKDSTTIVEGGGPAEDIKSRVALIRAQIEAADSEYDKEKLQERLAKLSGGVAILHVGATTEVEMKEKKARVEDALHATRAAIEEGIVPGGGVALLRAGVALDALKLEGDEKIGADIVKRAIKEPLFQIAVNAGEEGSVVVQRVLSEKGNIGYNAATNMYEDLVVAGIIDPKKVTRCALQNAASVAGLLLTTETLIVDIPEIEKSESNQAPMGY